MEGLEAQVWQGVYEGATMVRRGRGVCPASWTLQEILSFSIPEKSIYLVLLQLHAGWEMEVPAQH